MKTITIDFSEKNVKFPDGKIIGCEGIHNSVMLKTILPDRLICKEIQTYTMVFRNGEGETVLSDELLLEENSVNCLLWEQLLCGKELSVQVQGVGFEDGKVTVIDKTSVAELEIERSIDGKSAPSDYDVHAVTAQLTAIREKLAMIEILGSINGVCLSKSEINSKGELILTYSNGKSYNIGLVKGDSGRDGIDGTDGIPALHSWNGTTLTVTSASGTSSCDLKGDKGDKGEKGDKGDRGLDGKNGADGYTPVKGTDYFTEADKAEMSADSIAFVSTELAKRGQLKPEFAQMVDGCTDTSKLYVLPDGYIYAYMTKTVNPTNQLTKAVDTDGTPFNGGKGWKTGYFLNPSGGAESESTGYEVTGYIPYTYTQTFRAKNLTLETAHGYNSIAFYDKDFNFIKIFTMNSSYNPMSQFVRGDGTIEGRLADSLTSNITEAQKKTVAYFRIGCISIDDTTVITVDEPFEPTNIIGWHNTELAFVPADYEDRIIELEEKVNATPTNTSVVSLNSNTCSIFRKVVCCGDSFTAGYIDIGNGVQETNEDYSWVSFMARLTGNEYINCGASGATVLTWQTSTRGLSKAQSAGVAQAYLVGLGINDTSKVTLGTLADIGTDNQTYYGGMSKIVRELNTISPKAKIFLQTMPTNSETRQAYNEAVRVIVETYKDTYPVYLLDLDAYKSLYFVSTITRDSIGGHYTAIAYQQFAENLRYIWSEYINNNISDFQDVYSLPCD